ncbi:MAG: hypothetical protein ACC726_14450 [Chloroflexota bacterium]
MDGPVADFPTSNPTVFRGVDGYEGLTPYALLWVGSTGDEPTIGASLHPDE